MRLCGKVLELSNEVGRLLLGRQDALERLELHLQHADFPLEIRQLGRYDLELPNVLLQGFQLARLLLCLFDHIFVDEVVEPAQYHHAQTDRDAKLGE